MDDILTEFTIDPFFKNSDIWLDIWIDAASWASIVDAPRCGVKIILSKECKGESTSGSFSKTSKAAPAIFFLLKVLYKSFSFISPPLAAFIK